MARDLAAINRDLDAVEAQLASLEKSLKETRIKRTELTTERDAELQRLALAEQQEKERAAAAAAAAVAATYVKVAGDTGGGGDIAADAAALQARIAELQQQLEEEKKKQQVRSRSPTNRNSRTSPTRQRSPRSSRSPQRASAAARGSASSPPSSPRRQDPPAANKPEKDEVAQEVQVVVDDSEYKEKTGWKKPGWTIGRGGNKKNQEDTTTDDKAAVEAAPATTVTDSSPPASPSPPSPSQMECVSPYRNSKSTWEKPAWAHAAPLEEENNVAVDNTPITNPLLRPKQDGYQRKVFAKDLTVEHGTFIKAQEKQPDPRKTWIVVRINDDAVPGKIVMHLHGKHVNGLVDKFVDLQGQEIERTGHELMVHGEPKFFITTAAAKGLDSKQEVYGVVQEGHEIVEKLLAAGPEATFSIKQAHIFPIKKSKKG
jgi:hypothetical protein